MYSMMGEKEECRVYRKPVIGLVLGLVEWRWKDKQRKHEEQHVEPKIYKI